MNKHQLKDYTVYLDGVAPVRINAGGRHFHILSASSDVTLQFDGLTPFTRSQGQGGDVDGEFSEVTLSSAAPQSVIIALGYGKVRDSNAGNVNLNASVTTENANVNTHLPVVTCAAGVATLIASADINRKELRLNIDVEQSGGLFLGGAGITANKGGFIDIGQTDYISTQGALYAFNSSTESVEINLMSLERV